MPKPCVATSKMYPGARFVYVNSDGVADVANREKEIVAGKLKVFAGPLKDRDGKQRVAAGAVLPDNEVRSISWVVDGVKGAFPKS